MLPSRPSSTWIALLALALPAGCGSKVTEIVVKVDSDLRADGPDRELDSIELRVDYAKDDGPTSQDVSWDTNPEVRNSVTFPIQLGLVATKDVPSPLLITVRALRIGQTAPVVERKAQLSFVKDRILLLPLNLLRECVTARCTSDETCSEQGKCRPIAAPVVVPYTAAEAQRPLDARVDGVPPPHDRSPYSAAPAVQPWRDRFALAPSPRAPALFRFAWSPAPGWSAPVELALAGAEGQADLLQVFAHARRPFARLGLTVVPLRAGNGYLVRTSLLRGRTRVELLDGARTLASQSAPLAGQVKVRTRASALGDRVRVERIADGSAAFLACCPAGATPSRQLGR